MILCNDHRRSAWATLSLLSITVRKTLLADDDWMDEAASQEDQRPRSRWKLKVFHRDQGTATLPYIVPNNHNPNKNLSWRCLSLYVEPLLGWYSEARTSAGDEDATSGGSSCMRCEDAPMRPAFEMDAYKKSTCPSRVCYHFHSFFPTSMTGGKLSPR